MDNERKCQYCGKSVNSKRILKCITCDACLSERKISGGIEMEVPGVRIKF